MARSQTSMNDQTLHLASRSIGTLVADLVNDPYRNEFLWRDQSKSFSTIQRCFDICEADLNKCSYEFLRVVRQLSYSFDSCKRAQIVSRVPQLEAKMLAVAQAFLDSYSCDQNRASRFTWAAGVTIGGVIRALNVYYWKRRPQYVVDWRNIELYESLPEKYPDICPKWDHSQARQVAITVVVDGTLGPRRSIQEQVLRNNRMIFSDPREQVIAAAIHFCRHEESILNGHHVRGSVPWLELRDTRYDGLELRKSLDDDDLGLVGASGSPCSSR